MRILLAGGGSGGGATPLLAVAQELRRGHPAVELLYIGTAVGPERQLVEKEGIPFAAVQAGKLRRYLSLANLVDPFRVAVGVAQSWRYVRQFRPDVGFGAGGFASLPPLVACRLGGVPIVIHQQDAEPGLANRILAPVADSISVSLEASAAHFDRRKTRIFGNPVRPSLFEADRQTALRRFQLEPELPTLLVTGGGTGALGLNRLVAEAADELVECCQVIHLTGRGRQVPARTRSPRYHAFEFLVDEMPLALAAADVVVSRAGMATLTELSALGKPTLLIPMPRSHQWANARAFQRLGGADVRDQEQLSPGGLAEEIRHLLGEPARLEAMGQAMRAAMPRDAAQRLAEEVLQIAARRASVQ